MLIINNEHRLMFTYSNTDYELVVRAPNVAPEIVVEVEETSEQ